MTAKYIRDAIIKNANDIYFDYNGKHAGIESSAKNGIITYEMWFGIGDTFKNKTSQNIDEVFRIKFFDGKSLIDLLNIVEFDFA
ncbi:MAG: hypothetical protein LUH47_02860 [Clostridiales bacterium]|nr:hypothetical protein [Clostridiales bacterium]MCD8159075.1 hypothetical protein [Clostridiales bacterium]